MRVSILGPLILATSFVTPAIAQQETPAPSPPPSVHRKAKTKAHVAPSPHPSPTISPEDQRARDAGRSIGFVAAMVAVFLAYWIPSVVAFSRKHHNTTAIVVLNLFVGWTIAGWIISLIWACTSPPPAAAGKNAGV